MSKTIAEKLQIKSGTTVWISHPEHAELVGRLPAGVDTVDLPGDATTAILVAEDEASLRAELDEHGGHLTRPAVLWVAYPKGGRSDINRDTLWPILRQIGMRPISQVALSDAWSALRFRVLGPGEEFDPG